MGLTVAKCPACGADLNLEIDRDYFYCPYCGSKVANHDQRIVVEHVSRTIDEAEIKRIELEEKKILEDKERDSSTDVLFHRLGYAFLMPGIALILWSFFSAYSAPIRVLAIALIIVGAMFAAIGKK